MFLETLSATTHFYFLIEGLVCLFFFRLDNWYLCGEQESSTTAAETFTYVMRCLYFFLLRSRLSYITNACSFLIPHGVCMRTPRTLRERTVHTAVTRHTSQENTSDSELKQVDEKIITRVCLRIFCHQKWLPPTTRAPERKPAKQSSFCGACLLPSPSKKYSRRYS